MESASDKYIREHSTPQSEALEWIEKQTNIHTNYPRMLSGRVQGRFLTMLTELCGAREVLEIGCFTGYSALCFAYGVGEGGRVDTLEINDELEDYMTTRLGEVRDCGQDYTPYRRCPRHSENTVRRGTLLRPCVYRRKQAGVSGLLRSGDAAAQAGRAHPC